MKLRFAVVLASVAAVLALCAGSASARDGYVTSFDGTKIVYSFFPAANLAPGQRAPTVMVGPGWSQSRDSNQNSTSDGGLFGSVGVGPLRNAGFNVLTWDPRGFGDSGGNVEVDGPDYEGRDVSALIDFIAKQPEAQLDGPNDPRVGMNGVSYGGGIQLVAAAIDQRIDAITPTIAWNSLVTSLDKNQTAKGGWGSLLFGLGQAQSPTAGIVGGVTGQPAGVQAPRNLDPHISDAFFNGLATGVFPDPDVAWFASRGPGDLVSRIHIPTFLIQGTADTLFRLDEAVTNYGILSHKHVPLKMLWFCGGHGVCLTNAGSDKSLIEHEVIAWLSRYLKGDKSVDTGPGFEWISDDGVHHAADGYPLPQGAPLTATGSGTLPLVVGDTSGALIAATQAANAVNVSIPTRSTATQLVGQPTLSLTYSGTGAPADDRIYAQLVDDKTHIVLGNQVTPIPVTLDGATHSTTVPLEDIAIDATPGSTYTLQVLGGSNVYFAQRSAGVINLSRIQVSIPTVGAAAARADVPPSNQPAVSCADRRRFAFQLHHVRGARVTRAVVYIDGKLVKRVRGRNLTRLVITKFPEGLYRVKIVTFATDGAVTTSVRTYRGCIKTRPRSKTRRPHQHR